MELNSILHLLLVELNVCNTFRLAAYCQKRGEEKVFDDLVSNDRKH